MPPLTHAQLLDALVLPGGRGTADDVAAVRGEVARLSRPILAFLRRKKVKVVACRTSVTDFETSLRGKLPRGWDPAAGRTWDDVPGAYLVNRKRIVIATVDGPAGRTVPPKGRGHGSWNLAVHEAMHGHDIADRHRVTDSAAFRQARQADLARLPPYEAQAGRAGREETYAESAARHFAADPAFDADWPALAAWWRGGPAGLEAVAGRPGAEAVAALLDEPEPEPERAAIGTATRQADGSLLFDLRAEEPGVALGHAAFVEPSAGLEAAVAAGEAAGNAVLVMPHR